MRKEIELLILSLIFISLISSFASAQIGAGFGTDRIDGNLVEGEVRDIPAKVSNDGTCALYCSYNSPGFNEEKITDNLQPGQKYSFMAKFIVPACPDKCRIDVKIFCKEIGCTGQTYDSLIGFDILNVMPPGSSQQKQPLDSCYCDDNKKCEQFECKSCLDCGGQGSCYCDDNGKCESGECPECKDCLGEKNESGSTAEHVGQFIGIVLVVLIALVLFILIIFGIYRLIKFLFFRKGKEKAGEEWEEGKRKLSAIMFTDMKGYSREMGRDEEATLKKLWRYEKAMKEIIKEHDGRVVKTIGDAIMGDFNSAVNAVKSAIEIQNLLKKEDIKIRIGIHLGDVIHKGGDIFGDGVNIASRIESICEPGEIYISEDVYNQVKGKIRAGFENLGSRPLKNIESPPRVFRIK